MATYFDFISSFMQQSFVPDFHDLFQVINGTFSVMTQ